MAPQPVPEQGYRISQKQAQMVKQTVIYLGFERFLKYQAIMVEQDDVEIVVTNFVNPASFLSGSMGEPVIHECLEAIKATYSSCPDLKDTLPENTETWYTDGSSYVISGRHAGYLKRPAIMHIKAHEKGSSELDEENKLADRKAKEAAKGLRWVATAVIFQLLCCQQPICHILGVLPRMDICGLRERFPRRKGSLGLACTAQVDFRRQVLLTGIQTQGAKQFFKSLYIQKYFLVYSKDKRTWNTFKGDSSPTGKIFEGNSNAYEIKENIIDPPVIARYIRLYPTEFYNRPTLRMELLGCEVDGCSLPLGMESGEIKNTQITASSTKTSWFNTWDASLARLNQSGKMNAWRAKWNNNQQWLQIDLLTAKKITAIATQGVTSMSAENFVKTYVLLYSNEGSEWKSYTEGSSSVPKVFLGNANSNGHVKNFLNPPILSRFIRIVPKTRYRGIALRVELYGCDFGGGLAVKRTDRSLGMETLALILNAD
ncbi:hypothetical protein DUI87_17214 [Hirundo rustica rustica]|uniref:F5/8 type C domain-containing protein n=1 Tax=Hirundo rustica rustica TaxID=333673 RepID=A0A3M0K3A1_HIRRU|nr:hypothetical protein DUI87_17214 [Hirundo rustica rustica]